MCLNSKTALILVVPMLVLVGAFAWAIHSQVLGRFAALARAELEQNHDRLLQAIAAELDGLERVTRDWGIYDETYEYMLGSIGNSYALPIDGRPSARLLDTRRRGFYPRKPATSKY